MSSHCPLLPHAPRYRPAIERHYGLKVGTTPVEEGAPHERPYKPHLLLAALDLMDEGKAAPDRIPWCQDLRDRFTARFLLVRKYFHHPTNGLALCKNHNWAIDRDIIAPGPDLQWHVSLLIDPRCSNGEKDLLELAGESVLLPKDPAFHPDAEGLE